MKKKAQGQQYLKPYEEDVLVKYLLQMSDLGQPIRMKFIPSLAFSVTRHRPTTDRPLKPGIVFFRCEASFGADSGEIAPVANTAELRKNTIPMVGIVILQGWHRSLQ
jgi:hypothetical protein